MAMRLPRVLDNNFHELYRINPSALTATINLTPLSTASMTIPQDITPPGLRDWLEIYGPNESLGIFRVSRTSVTFGSQMKISLEHGITSLGDDITEADTTLEGSLSEIMEKLLSYQSVKRWKLGTAPTGNEYSLDVNRTSILQAVIDLLNQDEKYALTFDQTTSPWTVNIIALSDSPICEARISRNISGVTSTTDDSDLCTRVYSSALPNGYLDADTVADWGIIGKDLGIAEDSDQQEALEYAKEYLEKHKLPTFSVEMDGLDLSQATGEEIDRFRIGELCRIALPSWKTAINERIISIKYSDLLKTPEKVKLTLSTAVKDASNKLAGLRNATNSLASTSTRYGSSMRTVEAELEKTYRYTQELDGKLVTLDNYVGIQLDEVNATITLKATQLQSGIDGVAERVSKAEIEIDGANAAIRLKADQTVTDDLGKRLSAAEIDIDGANAAIALKASQSTVDDLGNRVTTAEATLTVQAGEISSKVSKDGVISSINQTPESVTINASKINLQGYVTASQLQSEVADINKFFAGTAQATRMDINTLTCQTAQITNVSLMNYSCAWGSKTVVTSIPDFLKSTITLANGNSISVVTGWATAPSRSTMSYITKK